MFDAFAGGLDEGLGNYRENDNFLGTTFAAGSKGLGESGDVVVASGEMVESMNGMPVFMQVDESSGAVTALGGTVSDLGVKVTDAGDRFAAEFSDDTTIGKGTAQLSAVVQPVMMQTEDGVGYAGDALLIGPVASKMLDQSAALFIKGAGVAGAADPRLSGPEKMMTGGAQMVSGGGKLLTAGGDAGNPPGFDGMTPGDIEGMKAGLGPVGDAVSMLGGAISQVETPVGSEVTSGAGEVLVQAGASISALDVSGSGQLVGALDGSASISNVLQAPVEQLSDTLTGGHLDAGGLEGVTSTSGDQDSSLSGATDGIEDSVDDGKEGLSGVVGGLTGGSL
ncbi:MAG: collagen-like triple helix repeat-containing protein [Guyparkeria sp.]